MSPCGAAVVATGKQCFIWLLPVEQHESSCLGFIESLLQEKRNHDKRPDEDIQVDPTVAPVPLGDVVARSTAPEDASTAPEGAATAPEGGAASNADIQQTPNEIQAKGGAQDTEMSEAAAAEQGAEQREGGSTEAGQKPEAKVQEAPMEDPSQQVVKLIATNQAASFADYFK